MASATPVTDHEEIRQWVESRGGRPACVKGTAALLRVDFGEPDEKLQPIEWDQWFETFDSRNLAALLQEGGSRFIKLVSRESAGARGGGDAPRGRSKGSRTPIKAAGASAGRNAGGARGAGAGDAAGGGRTGRTLPTKRAGAKSASKRAGRKGGASARAAANASGSTSGAGRKRAGATKAAGGRKGGRKGGGAGGGARKTGARAGAKRGGARSATRSTAGGSLERRAHARRAEGEAAGADVLPDRIRSRHGWASTVVPSVTSVDGRADSAGRFLPPKLKFRLHSRRSPAARRPPRVARLPRLADARHHC
jgi:hypothetical protein